MELTAEEYDKWSKEFDEAIGGNYRATRKELDSYVYQLSESFKKSQKTFRKMESLVDDTVEERIIEESNKIRSEEHLPASMRTELRDARKKLLLRGIGYPLLIALLTALVFLYGPSTVKEDSLALWIISGIGIIFCLLAPFGRYFSWKRYYYPLILKNSTDMDLLTEDQRSLIENNVRSELKDLVQPKAKNYLQIAEYQRMISNLAAGDNNYIEVECSEKNPILLKEALDFERRLESFSISKASLPDIPYWKLDSNLKKLYSTGILSTVEGFSERVEELINLESNQRGA